MDRQISQCDVLIVGAGMAGSCLARQLRRQQPNLTIINIDKRTSFSYWIGESTVEAWEDYMTRTLGLGDFLAENFPEKHGLRMFFDCPDKSLTLSEMSEFGRSAHHPVPARHLDRSRFDQAMVDLNRADGVDVRLGVAIPSNGAITIDGERGHTVETDRGTIRCRWLIDASGRNAPLARTLSLVSVDDHGHRSASYWGRFRGCRKLDELGDDSWRERVNGTRRYLSTNHFLYRGYWFWMISLSEDVVSIGVEFNREVSDLPVRGRADFLSFLRSHTCLAEIVGDGAEMLDFCGYVDLPRRARQLFSPDRWALAGMAGFFADVMGSGTSRIYSEVNRMIGRLIETDRAGDQARLHREAAYFNAHVRTTHRGFLRFLSDYELYGSFDVFSPYFSAGLAIYFNTHLPSDMADLASVFRAADELGGLPEAELENRLNGKLEDSLRSATYRLAAEFRARLDSAGAYYDGNRGRYRDSLPWENRPDIAAKWHKPRSLEAERAADRLTYETYVKTLVERLCEIEGREFDEDSFRRVFEPCWTSRQTLREVLDKMALPRPDVPARNGQLGSNRAARPFTVGKLFDQFGSLIESTGGSTIDDIDPGWIMEELTARGVVLFRGFGLDINGFAEQTRRFIRDFIVHGAEVRHRVSEHSATQTVTGGNNAICLHRELHFSPFSPQILWFYCETAPRRGGQTTVGDGVSFLDRLSRKARGELERRRLKYSNVWSLSTWQSYFPDRSREEVMRMLPELGMSGRFEEDLSLSFEYLASAVALSRCKRPAFANSIDVHRQYLQNVGAFQPAGDDRVRHGIAWEDGSPLSDDLFDEIHRIGLEHEREVDWRDGDLIMVDNTRIMHGRRAFPEGEDRRVYLRMAMWPDGERAEKKPRLPTIRG
ncbi:MAG: TauD/TfdA family dioxygenase [Proteobacteria bacterium]|nr:TauD/TfdA family dioxygenase [Pseudomonadota bacterium]